MATCTIPISQYTCKVINELLESNSCETSFDITGAKIEAEFRNKLDGPVIFRFTTDNGSVLITGPTTFDRQDRNLVYPVGVYYGDWTITQPNGSPLFLWRQQITIENTYTK